MTSPGILIQLECFMWDSANARVPLTSNIRSEVPGSFIREYSCCTLIDPFNPLSRIIEKEVVME